MKRIFIILCVCMMAFAGVAQTTQERYQAYIAKYAKAAQEQQKKYKIPASITLAQGLLESGAGQSDLATKANNHFGVKCGGNWTGETMLKDDDQKDDCFRKYKRVEDSFEDHSLFLLRPRYASLFELEITDYKGWARGLKACGYATDPGYAGKLIKIIEDYQLTDYDKVTEPTKETKQEVKKEREKEKTKEKTKEKAKEKEKRQPRQKKTKKQEQPAPVDTQTVDTQLIERAFSHADESMPVVDLNPERTIKRENGSRYIIARLGDTFERVAYEYNIDEKTLRHYNDIVNPRYELQEGDRVYLQRKHKKAAKQYARYFVRKGENIWQIAQDKGMQLKTIYKLNGIQEGQDVTVNQELRLR